MFILRHFHLIWRDKFVIFRGEFGFLGYKLIIWPMRVPPWRLFNFAKL
jgi:hypothetical protein